MLILGVLLISNAFCRFQTVASWAKYEHSIAIKAGVGQSFGPVAVRVTAPATYSLAQNHPNPFNPETAIEFALPNAGEVTLTIYNLTGQEVVTLVHERLDAGLHTALWNGRDRNGVELASGVYIYRITAGTFAKARKMVLVK